MNQDKADKLASYFNNTPALLEAANKAVREAVLRHKLLGQPIVVWQDGQVVWVPPQEIEVPDESQVANGRVVLNDGTDEST